MHKVFISYHHANDQWAKEALVKWAEENNIFIDGSVDTGDIPDNWSDEKIREEIGPSRNYGAFVKTGRMKC